MISRGALINVARTVATPIGAVRSHTYWYPVRGIFYFVRTPILWGGLLVMALPQFVLTVVVFTLAYAFLYPPQAALALLFNGPTGLFTAWIAIIQQSFAITQLLSAMLLMPTPLRVMFDTILTKEGYDRLVLSGKLRPQSVESDQRKITSFIKRLPFRLVLPVWAFQILMRLALNLIPLVGPITLILMDSTSTAIRCHSRYFDLKGLDKVATKNYVNQRWGQFFAFGVIAAALESIPFIGMAFMFSNTAGGALWAVNTEQKLAPRATPRPRRSRMKFFID